MSLNTVFYSIISFFCYNYIKKFEASRIMTFGVILGGISLILIGSGGMILSQSIIYIVIGQCFLGISGALIQSNKLFSSNYS